MEININKKDYLANNNEFTKHYIEKYCNLNILNDVGNLERLTGLITEISETLHISNFININPTHGGFLPINCSYKIPNIYLYYINLVNEHIHNINSNILKHKIPNINLINNLDEHILTIPTIIFTENCDEINFPFYEYKNIILITNKSNKFINKYDIELNIKDTNYVIYLFKENYYKFYKEFGTYIEDKILNYDNLIHLCIMVKNGGEQFENMLLENLKYIDKWTILDTGSTDNTINIIDKILIGKKKGNLYHSPFTNFKDCRNKLINLAGQSCKYILMLDDTYIVKGDLRTFLNNVRGDQFSDSFSFYIQSNDVEYSSTRLIKTDRNLKYIYKIHEVIQKDNNNNVIIPMDDAYIFDGRFDYMETRTTSRKSFDLKLLYEELEENPNDPRTHYYLAQTYKCIDDYQNAFKWYMERVNHPNPGFIQEKIDATFEAARTANFYLNMDWNICEKLYLDSYELDKTRADALYFIGMHYYLQNDFNQTYTYLKKVFETGYPAHCQYSLKPTLYFHFLPKFLAKICYQLKDYELGLQASKKFLLNNDEKADSYEEIVSWYKIYDKINIYNNIPNKDNIKFIKKNYKPVLCFVADGGFNTWSGKNILTTGVGGSETYIIEMARYIQKQGQFKVYVFCNCEYEEIFEDVQYYPLTLYYEFINNNIIHTCIISRYSEYIPVSYKGLIDNIYLVLHDLGPSGIVIPIDKKLKKIFCLTEWHSEYVKQIFPQLQNIIVPFYYGIDFNKFHHNRDDNHLTKKIPYKFIYSSFPNRGLLQLLQMWREIYNIQPQSSLYIYSDIDGKWVNNVAPEQIKQIKLLLDEYKNLPNNLNIYYYGWVDKDTLAKSWLSSDIWFYPCTFKETFCLTALEAALTKTFVITNDLAALQNTVNDRGIVIKGDSSTKEWQNNALNEIKKYINNNPYSNIDNKKQYLINKNYEWATTLSWKNQAEKLVNNYLLQE